MFYDFSFTIPKTATKDAPEVMELNLTYGVVHRITLSWWPGPHGLVYVTICQHRRQLLPSNIDEGFHYDNYTHILEERIELFEPPFTLEAIGWADGCDYDHEVKVGIGILPPSSFSEYQEVSSKLDYLLKLFGIK